MPFWTDETRSTENCGSRRYVMRFSVPLLSHPCTRAGVPSPLTSIAQKMPPVPAFMSWYAPPVNPVPVDRNVLRLSVPLLLAPCTKSILPSWFTSIGQKPTPSARTYMSWKLGELNPVPFDRYVVRLSQPLLFKPCTRSILPSPFRSIGQKPTPLGLVYMFW